MDNREIIEEFKNNLKYGFNISDKAAEIAIQAIEELEQYKELGTPEQVREAVEQTEALKEFCTPEQARKIAIVAYADYMFAPEDVKKFEMIENALGFKLYSWQKSYLAIGHYRRIGSTTAECLKRLLFNHSPIDFSERPRNMKEACERETMLRIYSKLQEAGVATNPILRNPKEKADYMRGKYMNEREFERLLFEAERKRAENEQRRFIT